MCQSVTVPVLGRVALVGQQEAQSRASITTSVWLHLSSDFKPGQEEKKKKPKGGKNNIKKFCFICFAGQVLVLVGTHSEAPPGAWGSL